MNAEQDPFASVRINQRGPSQPQPVNQLQNGEDPFSDARIKKAEGFPGVYETGRHALRIGSRIAETLGGIPGDTESLLRSGLFAGMEKLTGKKVPHEEREKARGKIKFPTSKELKETYGELSGGLTEPQSRVEEIGDDITTTVTSLLGPMKFRKALGVGISAQSVKEGIKVLGLGEGIQEAGKFGTMFLLSIINPGGAMKYASSQYDKANQLAKGASIKATGLESNLKSLHTDLQKGVTTSAKNVVIKPIEDLLAKINKGKIPVDELTAAKRDINTLMGDPALLKRERNLLKTVGREVDNAIKPFEKINPAFKKTYRPANEIYGAVMQGNKASNFIKKTLGLKSVLGATIGEAALGHPEAILPTMAGIAGVHGLAHAADFMQRVAKSTELQKFYTKAMMAAAAEDAATLRLYEDKIEEYLNSHQSGSKPRK